jgi:DNA-nicking Smr family endonuclease
MAKDVDLFADAMVGVTPLKGAKRRRAAAAKPRVTSPGRTTEKATAKEPAARPTSATPSPRPALPHFEVFDRDVDRALARGKRRPQASLDLHGMTLAAAERAVANFLGDSADRGLRVVLVVTGKGLRMESGRVFGGRIRAEFPKWLERPENRGRVAGLRAAHPRHGGSGAYYVLLRRRAVRA